MLITRVPVIRRDEADLYGTYHNNYGRQMFKFLRRPAPSSLYFIFQPVINWYFRTIEQ